MTSGASPFLRFGTVPALSPAAWRVLQTIRRLKCSKRRELQQYTQLSWATVSEAIDVLIELGMVQHARSEIVSGRLSKRVLQGRPATALELNLERHVIVGIDFAWSDLSIQAFDLAGTLKDGARTALECLDLKSITKQILRLSHESDFRRKVLAVGVGVPLLLGVKQGNEQPDLRIALVEQGLLQGLSEIFEAPVFLGGNVQAMALAEHYFGSSPGSGNFLYCSFRTGIGMSAFLNDRIYAGHSGHVGELGHLTVTIDGKRCACGRNGCLETVAGGPALLAQAETLGWKVRASERTLQRLLEAAHVGNSSCIEALTFAALYAGSALGTLANLFDPERIIVGGTFAESPQSVREALERKYKTACLYGSTQRQSALHFSAQQTLAEGAARAAAALALEGLAGRL